jgi:hypothetical protein
MKVRIAYDDYFPFYFLTDTHGIEVEISEEKLERFKKIFHEFDAMQEELEAIHNGKEVK